MTAMIAMAPFEIFELWVLGGCTQRPVAQALAGQHSMLTGSTRAQVHSKSVCEKLDSHTAGKSVRLSQI